MDKIQTVEELTAEFASAKNTNTIHRERLSRLDRLALLITKKVGTMGFFFIIFFWTALWLSWNMFAPIELRFDPFPAFVFWLFISNLIQIHLMPLIMVGQNIQSKHALLRAEHAFQAEQKAEKEIETILLRLENQEQLMQKILEKLEKK